MQAIGSAPLLLPSRQSPAASPVFCFNVAALGVRCSVLGKLISPHLPPYHTCISEGRRIQRITLRRMPKCCSDYSQTMTLQPIHERNTFSPTQESFSHHLLPYTELTVVPAHKPRNQKLCERNVAEKHKHTVVGDSLNLLIFTLTGLALLGKSFQWF